MRNELFKSLIHGDAKGIQKTYDLVFPRVLQFVLKNNGYKDDAKDVFQEALIQLITRFKSIDKDLDISLEAYLFTMCKNLWRQELNKKKRVTKELETTYTIETNDEIFIDEDIEVEKRELYQSKFDELSDNCKIILTLFYKKASYKEMIEILPYRNEATIRQRVFKCRKKLSFLIRSDIRFTKIKAYDD